MARQGARDRDHLLLAAREQFRIHLVALAQAREHRKYPLVIPSIVPVARAPESSEHQVIPNRQPRKKAPPLWNKGNAKAGHDLGNRSADRLACDVHHACSHARHPDQALEQRRLARPVAPQHGHDLPLVDGEPNARENMTLTVKRLQPADFQRDLVRHRCVRNGICEGLRTGTDIDFAHPRVGSHHVRRGFNEHLALIHDGDAVSDGEHAVDVMIDKQHADALAQRVDQPPDPITFGSREPRQRFIKQQDGRRRAQGKPHVDQTLPAIGQILGGCAIHALDPQKADQGVSLFLYLAYARHAAPE